MDEIDVGFVQSLMDLQTVGETKTYFLSGSLIYEARERLATAREQFRQGRYLTADELMQRLEPHIRSLFR